MPWFGFGALQLVSPNFIRFGDLATLPTLATLTIHSGGSRSCPSPPPRS